MFPFSTLEYALKSILPFIPHTTTTVSTRLLSPPPPFLLVKVARNLETFDEVCFDLCMSKCLIQWCITGSILNVCCTHPRNWFIIDLELFVDVIKRCPNLTCIDILWFLMWNICKRHFFRLIRMKVSLLLNWLFNSFHTQSGFFPFFFVVCVFF